MKFAKSVDKLLHNCYSCYRTDRTERSGKMIQLDYRDPRPVYEQIKEKIKELVVAKVLKADDKIFSVREMSAYLTINPNTILKAYKELENEGYIYSFKGKGYFVADRKVVMETVDKAPIYEKVEEGLKQLYYLGESKEEAIEIIEKIWENK